MSNIFDSTPGRGQFIRLVQFDEYDDVVARIFSSKGSSPIILQSNGVEVSDEEVGRRFREVVTSLLETERTGE